jgi:N-acetylglucosaminyl-diphospho-decaprenol L-rhamnosyltransferase
VGLSAVVVAHDSAGELATALPPLLDQLHPDDELIVVDSGSRDGLAELMDGVDPRARLVTLSENVGFAAAANRGVAEARRELVVLLNPDAVVQPGWASAIRAQSGGPWAAWMGLGMLERGARINTSGGVLHFTGFGWAGQIGQPLSAAPRVPSEVGFVSGACLALPRAAWLDSGGFPEHFFMYCEDVDLSLRLRLAGGRLAVIPDARFIHNYEFARGPWKWRLLERNRWAVILRTYPSALLVLLMPALLAAEVAVWLFAIRDGWGRTKTLATLDVLRALPRLMRERRAIQARRRVSAQTFAATMTAELGSPYFGDIGQRAFIRRALELYWRLVRALLPGSSQLRGRQVTSSGSGRRLDQDGAIRRGWRHKLTGPRRNFGRRQVP